MNAEIAACEATRPWRPGLDTSWALVAGAVLPGGLRVLRRLGGGGAHEAFLVACGTRSPTVAKLPRPHLTRDQRCLRRLLEEGRALDRLAHPALPRRLDTVLTGSHPHLLLEYVPGPTLRDIVRSRGAVAPAIVASVGAAVARALEHIAAAGWVHLDVKPSNILLGASPHLLDFELARPFEEAARIDEPLGTWHYMPPEQRAAGLGSTPIGPPADVFALARSLADALAGRPDGPLGALLRDALAPLPGDRPTAGELATGLTSSTPPVAARRRRCLEGVLR